MSAVSPTARSKTAARIALIRSRTGINPVLFLLFPLVLALYPIFALRAELIGQSGTAVVILTVLAIFCFAGMALRRTADRLELFRVVSFYFLMAFCIGPLYEPAISRFVHDDPKPLLLERTAMLALFAYLCVALGYHLPLYRAAPAVVMTRHEAYNKPLATTLGLALFATGVVSFLALFVLAGGAAVILRGEGDVHRTEFAFGGLGWFYWAALFMLPGGAVYFAAQTSQKRFFPWIHGWPLVSAFALLLLLQGRHRAIGPILIMFFVSNYTIRRLRLLRLSAYAVVGVALAIVMSAARQPHMRGTFIQNPIAFTSMLMADFPERAAEVMAGDIGRVDEVMLVVDHVPDRMPYDYGLSLSIPFNPIRRLIWGPEAEAPLVGERLYVISRPDMRGAKKKTGFLPSLVGEMRANFPVLLCAFPYVLFGMALRFVYQRLIVTGADFLSVAAYSIITFHLGNMVLGAFGQQFFEMLVVSVPVFAVRFASRRRGRSRARALAGTGSLQEQNP
jgi:hypothetical protein